MIGDGLIPQARQDGCHRGLAYFTAVAATMPANQLLEGANALDLDDLEQFLPGAGEMLAQGIANPLAGSLDLRLEKIGNQRQTAAATGARARANFDLFHRRKVLARDRIANLALGDVVAGADRRVIGYRGDEIAGASRRVGRQQK